MTKYNKKQRSKQNFPFLPVVLLVLILIIAVILIIILPKDKPSPEPNSSSSSSKVVEPPKPNYEERVGKEYKIDITEYLEYIEPKDKDEFVFLVNPTHTLASDFVPNDLVDSIYTRKDGRATQQLRINAAKALEAFLAEGKLNGVNNITITSAYRSYSYQDYLFNLYCEQNQHKFATREECEEYVLTFSTKPGTSEHQSGLCMDMHNLPSASEEFAKTPEAQWLAENCYRFGFILRYPEDKTDITKIIYEPWHFRFVGREAATKMNELGMCLEEYIDYLGKK